MITEIVAIYDNKAKAYLSPVHVQSTGAAMRSFADAVNSPDTDFGKHPSDYSMWHLGSFNDTTGEFTLFENKTILSEALSLVVTLGQVEQAA